MTLGGDRVIAPVPVAAAGFALFLDVGDFAAGRHFAIAADHATAAESGEAEKSNETHDTLRRFQEQVVCRRACGDHTLAPFTYRHEMPRE